VEGVTDGENEGDDCDEVIYVGWGEPGGAAATLTLVQIRRFI